MGKRWQGEKRAAVELHGPAQLLVRRGDALQRSLRSEHGRLRRGLPACTAVWQGVHFTNFAGEKVACGVTGPRGNNAPRSSRPSLSPLAFMTLTKRAG